jgi:hypothetical protein
MTPGVVLDKASGDVLTDTGTLGNVVETGGTTVVGAAAIVVTAVVREVEPGAATVFCDVETGPLGLGDVEGDGVGGVEAVVVSGVGEELSDELTSVGVDEAGVVLESRVGSVVVDISVVDVSGSTVVVVEAVDELLSGGGTGSLV